jgi:hypothetical protein
MTIHPEQPGFAQEAVPQILPILQPDVLTPHIGPVVYPGEQTTDAHCQLPPPADSGQALDIAQQTVQAEPQERLEIPPAAEIRYGALVLSEVRTDNAIEHETDLNRSTWGVVNSGLSEGDTPYEPWFREVIPRRYDTLQEYVTDVLLSLPPEDRSLLDVGGIGSAVAAEIPEGVLRVSAGSSLTDLRNRLKDSEAIKAADEARNHHVVTGDMRDDRTKQKIRDTFDNKKIGVIVERMLFGIDTLPEDVFTMAEEASALYDMLAKGGLLIAEVPPALLPHLGAWHRYVLREHPGFDVRIDSLATARVVAIRKNERAPDSLPLFSARSILRLQKEQYIKAMRQNNENIPPQG